MTDQPEVGTTGESEKKMTVLSRMVGGGEKGEKLQLFRNALDLYRPELEAALMGKINPDHFIEVATTALMDPKSKLLECHPPSVFIALRRAAQLNLRPDGEEGALIGYYDNQQKKRIAVFQPMYKGLVRTILRTGVYEIVEAFLHRTGDEWFYQLGLNPDIRHIPVAPSDRGEIEHAYAIVTLVRNGKKQFEVMHREELDEIRQAAKVRNNGKEGPAWKTAYGAGQMYRKMPIKRLAKLLELDPEQAAVFWYDDQIEAGRRHPNPADRDPSTEYRDINERVEGHADRQTADLRQAMADMNAEPPTIQGDPVEEGIPEESILDQMNKGKKFPGKTWHELIHGEAAERGYVTHWAVTGKSGDMLTADEKAELEEYAAELKAKVEGDAAGGDDSVPPAHQPEPGSGKPIDQVDETPPPPADHNWDGPQPD